MNKIISLATVALVAGVFLTLSGCGTIGGPLGKAPLLGNRAGSNASPSKVVNHDPFPTAAQAGVSNQLVGKK